MLVAAMTDPFPQARDIGLGKLEKIVQSQPVGVITSSAGILTAKVQNKEENAKQTISQRFSANSSDAG